MRNNREYRRKRGLEALIAALRRLHVGLQEARVGLDLRCQQKGHVEDVGPLGKAFANALFFGIGIRHGGSVQDSDVEGQKTGLRHNSSALSCNPRIGYKGMKLNWY